MMVAQARAAGIPWKILERIYDRDRIWLWKLATGHKKQNGPDKQQAGAGATTGELPILAYLNRQQPEEDEMGGGGSAPPAPAVVAPPPPPTLSDPAVSNASQAEQAAAARAKGRAATVLTGGMGLMAAPQTQQKVLLGQ